MLYKDSDYSATIAAWLDEASACGFIVDYKGGWTVRREMFGLVPLMQEQNAASYWGA